MKVHIVMPMAGAGSRFSEKGYDIPKPYIDFNGKKFFEWSLESAINGFKKDSEIYVTFAVLKEHIDKGYFSLTTWCPDMVKRITFMETIVIDEVLPSPIDTCRTAVQKSSVNKDIPVFFNDCDHKFFADNLESVVESNCDGALFTFTAKDPAFGYVVLCDGKFFTAVEKQVVSDQAICGLYYFRNSTFFIESTEDSSCRFMSEVYNNMRDKNISVKKCAYNIDFGTPEKFQAVLDSPYFSDDLEETTFNGNSGCKLSLVEIDHRLYVKKKSASLKYNSRLVEQARLQKSFKNSFVRTPEIISENVENGCFYFIQEYIEGETLFDFIKTGKHSEEEIENVISQLMGYINYNRLQQKVNKNDDISHKIECLDPGYNPKVYEILKNFDCSEFKDFVSPCHGDLTLENIIVSNGILYFIDFLDSFHDSVYIDAACILQDSLCQWSSRYMGKLYQDKFEFINKKLMSNFSYKEQKFIYFLLLLKLYRIYPYSKDLSTRSFLDLWTYKIVEDYLSGIDNLVVCDLDGTLIDNKNIIAKSYIKAIRMATGDHVNEQWFMENCFGKSYKQFLPLVNVFLPEKQEEIHELKQNIYKEYIPNISVNKALVKILEMYNKNPRDKVVLFTTASLDVVNLILDKLDLRRLFDIVVTGNTVTRKKPDPEGYHKIFDYYDIDDDTKVVVFEDSEDGIEAARKIKNSTIFKVEL